MAVSYKVCPYHRRLGDWRWQFEAGQVNVVHVSSRKEILGMTEKKLKVYCETSFWSYLNGRPKTVATVTKAGFNCPVIITPMDFLERKEEFGL